MQGSQRSQGMMAYAGDLKANITADIAEKCVCKNRLQHGVCPVVAYAQTWALENLSGVSHCQ